MKPALFIAILLLSLSCKKSQSDMNDRIETQPAILQRNVVQVNGSIGGFYSALPVYYASTTKRYPLLIFLHGSGQIGDGDKELYQVLAGGVPALLEQKIFPSHFLVNGEYYSFIVLVPQFNELPKNETIYSFLTYAKQHYRIDTSRIYISGLSAGGTATSDFGAAYASSITAIVPISGVSLWFDLDIKAKQIADGKLPMWAFHNEGDATIKLSEVEHFMELINANHPPVPPKLTKLLPFGIFNHDAWTRATDPTCKVDGMNMYEWMLQYARQ